STGIKKRCNQPVRPLSRQCAALKPEFDTPSLKPVNSYIDPGQTLRQHLFARIKLQLVLSPLTVTSVVIF
ncbi:MAG: hypothetical protein J6L74_12535, partial [Pseudomonas sp.]|nr:hypothetical protein [Pseudomonas sp.]